MLAPYHQEHPDRAAEAKHVLNARRQRQKLGAPSVVPQAPVLVSPCPLYIETLSVSSFRARGSVPARLRRVRPGDTSSHVPGGVESAGRGLVCHNVEANYRSKAVRDDRYLSAPGSESGSNGRHRQQYDAGR